jgi:diphthamide biosynthesis protein 2
MESERLTFSESGQAAIARTIQVDANETVAHLSSVDELQQFFETDRTSEEIIHGDFKRVRCIWRL